MSPDQMIEMIEILLGVFRDERAVNSRYSQRQN